VVTGAASGIGRAFARQLAAEGHRVHLADLSPTETLAAEIGGIPAVVDVSSDEDMIRMARQVVNADVVCLNAGIVGTSLGAPWEVPTAEWTKLFEVNVLGVVNGLRAFVPSLVEAGRPALLVVTASLAGLLSFPGGGAYAATKHAVVALAEQTELALRDSPVTVSVLCPALVRTAMSEVGEDPADVAAATMAVARAGRFLVLPDQWRTAVRSRTGRLLAGDDPEIPAPEQSPPDRSRS